MTDRLRALWDFDDLGESERRFREALAGEEDDGRRAELLTQLARVQGLRGNFGAGERLLEEAAAAAVSDGARIRIDLERGRLRRSSGDREAALPLFESAFAAALGAGEHFLAGDAAHMAALAASDRRGREQWTERGVALGDSDDEARYWRGPLLNNLGWELYEEGEYDAALEAFEGALAARQEDAGNPAEIEIARYAVAKTLRALGRPAEGAAALEQAVAWADGAGRPDGWFHEELALTYAALGRRDEAAANARRALELLPVADSSFEPDHERPTILQSLAAGSAGE